MDGIYDILAHTKDQVVARVEGVEGVGGVEGGNTTISMIFETNDVNHADWPQTVEQAVGRILAEMPEEWKERVRSMPRADLVVFHFGWGTGIRKAFGLWGGNTALMRSCAEESGYSYLDADWASMVIIEAVWKRLRTFGP